MTIAVFGSINMDITAYSERLPRPGETLHGSRYLTGLGGKGANQAAAAAKLGADTHFIGRLGKDHFGSSALACFGGFRCRDNPRQERLRKSHRHCDHQRRCQGRELHHRHRRREFRRRCRRRRGCTPAPVRKSPYCSCSWKSLGRHDAGRPRMPASMAQPSYSTLRPPSRIRTNGFGLLDIITPNEVECESLTGIPPKDAGGGGRSCAIFFTARGPSTVILKLGDSGVYVSAPGGKSTMLDAFRVKARSTLSRPAIASTAAWALPCRNP